MVIQVLLETQELQAILVTPAQMDLVQPPAVLVAQVMPEQTVTQAILDSLDLVQRTAEQAVQVIQASLVTLVIQDLLDLVQLPAAPVHLEMPVLLVTQAILDSPDQEQQMVAMEAQATQVQ